MITRHALRAQRARSRNRILLAEDNLVNQKVARSLLEKMNFRVDVVADGLAAIAAWQTGKFDLIIMDCQMPQLDGYAATREIRRLEAGKSHIPIVALTAHAMKGDEEKCRAAGMDDYLSKPIDRAKLDASLERLLPSTLAILPAAVKEPSPQGAEDGPGDGVHSAPVPLRQPVDWQSLLSSIDGDQGFARDLADAFIGTGDRELSTIVAALNAGDTATLRLSAHTLKGASANLRASAASAAAAELESAAGSGMNARLPALAENLVVEVRRVVAFLKSGTG
jgi:CheY-like chemotaxis protein